MISSCGKKADLSETAAADVITSEYTALLDCTEDSNDLIRALNDGFSISIDKISESEDGYLVKCKVSNYDVAAAFDQMDLTDTEMTLNEFFQALVERLENGDKTSTSIEITVTEANGIYSTAFNEEQFDAATGGLLSFYSTSMEGQ